MEPTTQKATRAWNQKWVSLHRLPPDTKVSGPRVGVHIAHVLDWLEVRTDAASVLIYSICLWFHPIISYLLHRSDSVTVSHSILVINSTYFWQIMNILLCLRTTDKSKLSPQTNWWPVIIRKNSLRRKFDLGHQNVLCLPECWAGVSVVGAASQMNMFLK